LRQTSGRFIAYYRVSTQKQGVSGLGLEAQRAAVGEFAAARGGTVRAEFEEVESGRKAARPQLRRALEMCRQTGAKLLIAKLDRLARNVAFLSSLMEGDVEFLALDLPGANRFTLHIMAAVAEQEARATGERTKAALAAYKARGGKLGHPENLTDASRAASKAAINAKTAERYRHIGPLVLSLRASGLSLYAIAAKLNELRRELDTEWRAVQVSRVLRYAERGRVA
jgi:DNA invertase Pin-like site-specific DNA recombinase